MTNGLVQHITVEESTSIQWVNVSLIEFYRKADNSQPAPALDVERSQRFLENPADVHIFVSPSGSDTKNDG